MAAPAPASTFLDQLRAKTLVDCDTLDASVATKLGPFEDCTSNQAIALGELQKPQHHALLQAAAAKAIELSPQYDGISTVALAVELSMVSLALLLTPHIRGFVHIQTNPYDAYSTPRTIAAAHRLLAHFHALDPSFPDPHTRVCIKIPSTWEGLQACRALSTAGIATLATTLFSLEQAAVAGAAGCRYIAPYVHDLRAQVDAGFSDPAPIPHLCVTAQAYFAAHGLRTQVLPASLMSAAECLALAGVHHITVAPRLLEALAAAEPEPGLEAVGSLFEGVGAGAEEGKKGEEGGLADEKLQRLVDDEEGFRMAFTRCEGGRAEVKQVFAINIFCGMQRGLEELLGRYLEA